MYSKTPLIQIASNRELDRLIEAYGQTGMECIRQFLVTGEKDWYFAGFSAREDYLAILAEIERRERLHSDTQPPARWLNE